MTNKTDYEDYHKFSWQVPGPPFSNKSYFKSRGLFIGIFILTSFFGSRFVAYKQNFIVIEEMHLLLFVLLIIVLTTTSTIDYIISKAKPRKISSYSISKKGINIDTMNIPFKKNFSSRLISKDPITKKNNFYQIKLKIKPRTHILKFNTRQEASKFIQTLGKYYS